MIERADSFDPEQPNLESDTNVRRRLKANSATNNISNNNSHTEARLENTGHSKQNSDPKFISNSYNSFHPVVDSNRERKAGSGVLVITSSNSINKSGNNKASANNGSDCTPVFLTDCPNSGDNHNFISESSLLTSNPVNGGELVLEQSSKLGVLVQARVLEDKVTF